MSLLSWWTNTFSTMPRMFTGGLGKNSNQCWHQFTDRTNKTEKRKKYNWNVKASDILDKFSTNFRLSNAKILVKLSFDKLWTCLKRLYNLIIIIIIFTKQCVFPRLHVSACFDLWLVQRIIYVCRYWPEATAFKLLQQFDYELYHCGHEKSTNQGCKDQVWLFEG